jgi:hypothetical protein
LVLQGLGDGNFKPLTMLQSGVTITGNGKALVKLRAANGQCLVAATQNRGPMMLFRQNSKPGQNLRWQPDDAYAILRSANGKVVKVEAYYGTSFLSQSSRLLTLPPWVVSCTVVNTSGKERRVETKAVEQ